MYAPDPAVIQQNQERWADLNLDGRLDIPVFESIEDVLNVLRTDLGALREDLESLGVFFRMRVRISTQGIWPRPRRADPVGTQKRATTMPQASGSYLGCRGAIPLQPIGAPGQRQLYASTTALVRLDKRENQLGIGPRQFRATARRFARIK